MSKPTLIKIPAFLIGLLVIAASVYPVFAESGPDSVEGGNVSVIREIPSKPVIRNQTDSQRPEVDRKVVEDGIEFMREKLASKAAKLRLKLQTFRDQRKAEIAERVNTNLNKINQNRTDQMQKHLDRMSQILDKLEARVNESKPDIKDPAAARSAIADAKSAISSASAAVSEQALKDYTIVVTSENRIGRDAKLQRDKLHSDLVAVRRLVLEARQAVANTIIVAKSGKIEIPGVDKEGTKSGE